MSNDAERALRHAVRPRIVVRYIGQLSLLLGVAALVPVLTAVLLGEWDLLPGYGGVAAALLVAGVSARRMQVPRDLQRNEALVIAVGAFLLSPLVLSSALVAQGIPWLDALFEAISGVTTTGLSTLASVEHRPGTFLVARAWMQWVGGLGFVVLSVALMLEPGMAARRLAASSLDPDIVGSMRAHARRVLAIYLGLTAFGLVVLLAFGATLFDAVVHTFAGVSTGGFAPRDGSLAALGRGLQTAVLCLSLLGAVSLPLYAQLRRGIWRQVLRDPEVRALLLSIAIVGTLVFASLRVAGGAQPAADVALLSVSAQTTSGFSTLPIGELPDASKAVLLVSMLTGGSHGSTAGGVKLLRLLIVLRLVQWLIVRTRLPDHAVSWPTLAGQRMEPPDVIRAAATILLFLGVVVVSWLVFLVYGYAPLDALFEVGSATGTVGLTVGISRPELEPALKAVLCADMLLGRLEVFALLVALSPRTWIGRRAA